MLIITRNVGESFYIGESIKVTIRRVQQNQVRVAIIAPQDTLILRSELRDSEPDAPEERLDRRK